MTALAGACTQVEKAEKRDETVAVAVVQLVPPGASASGAAGLAASRFLLVQRPPSGLLAGLWQFPLLQLAEGAEDEPRRQQQVMDEYLEAQLGLRLAPQPGAMAAKHVGVVRRVGSGASGCYMCMHIAVCQTAPCCVLSTRSLLPRRCSGSTSSGGGGGGGSVAVVERRLLGSLVHVFSHIRMTMKVERILLQASS